MRQWEKPLPYGYYTHSPIHSQSSTAVTGGGSVALCHCSASFCGTWYHLTLPTTAAGFPLSAEDGGRWVGREAYTSLPALHRTLGEGSLGNEAEQGRSDDTWARGWAGDLNAAFHRLQKESLIDALSSWSSSTTHSSSSLTGSEQVATSRDETTHDNSAAPHHATTHSLSRLLQNCSRTSPSLQPVAPLVPPSVVLLTLVFPLKGTEPHGYTMTTTTTTAGADDARLLQAPLQPLHSLPTVTGSTLAKQDALDELRVGWGGLLTVLPSPPPSLTLRGDGDLYSNLVLMREGRPLSRGLSSSLFPTVPSPAPTAPACEGSGVLEVWELLSPPVVTTAAAAPHIFCSPRHHFQRQQMPPSPLGLIAVDVEKESERETKEAKGLLLLRGEEGSAAAAVVAQGKAAWSSLTAASAGVVFQPLGGSCWPPTAVAGAADPSRTPMAFSSRLLSQLRRGHRTATEEECLSHWLITAELVLPPVITGVRQDHASQQQQRPLRMRSTLKRLRAGELGGNGADSRPQRRARRERSSDFEDGGGDTSAETAEVASPASLHSEEDEECYSRAALSTHVVQRLIPWASSSLTHTVSLRQPGGCLLLGPTTAWLRSRVSSFFASSSTVLHSQSSACSVSTSLLPTACVPFIAGNTLRPLGGEVGQYFLCHSAATTQLLSSAATSGQHSSTLDARRGAVERLRQRYYLLAVMSVAGAGDRSSRWMTANSGAAAATSGIMPTIEQHDDEVLDGHVAEKLIESLLVASVKEDGTGIVGFASQRAWELRWQAECSPPASSLAAFQSVCAEEGKWLHFFVSQASPHATGSDPESHSTTTTTTTTVSDVPHRIAQVGLERERVLLFLSYFYEALDAGATSSRCGPWAVPYFVNDCTAAYRRYSDETLQIPTKAVAHSTRGMMLGMVRDPQMRATIIAAAMEVVQDAMTDNEGDGRAASPSPLRRSLCWEPVFHYSDELNRCCLAKDYEGYGEKKNSRTEVAQAALRTINGSSTSSLPYGHASTTTTPPAVPHPRRPHSVGRPQAEDEVRVAALFDRLAAQQQALYQRSSPANHQY